MKTSDVKVTFMDTEFISDGSSFPLPHKLLKSIRKHQANHSFARDIKRQLKILNTDPYGS